MGIPTPSGYGYPSRLAAIVQVTIIRPTRPLAPSNLGLIRSFSVVSRTVTPTDRIQPTRPSQSLRASFPTAVLVSKPIYASRNLNCACRNGLSVAARSFLLAYPIQLPAYLQHTTGYPASALIVSARLAAFVASFGGSRSSWSRSARNGVLLGPGRSVGPAVHPVRCLLARPLC